MRRLLACLLMLGLVGAFATDARANDLYVVVDGTAAVGETVPLSVRSGRPGQVVVRAWRIRAPDALEAAGIALDRGEHLAFLDPKNVRVPARERELRAQVRLQPVLLGVPIQLGANLLEAKDIALDTPGLYLLAVGDARRQAYATALVSDLGLVVKRSAHELVAWVVHRTTGAPWRGATVTVKGAAGAPLTGTTDARGIARFSAPLPAAVQVKVTSGDHLAFGTVPFHGAAAADRRVFLHTHQPAYRPGERVEVRGIVRALEGGALHLDPASSQAHVRLVAPDQTERHQTTVDVSNAMGTFAAGFDLTEDAPTGDWSILAEIGDKSYVAPLVVAAYRKPAFEVRVSAGDTPRVLAGTPAAFDVEASFYDGGRLGQAAVSWKLIYTRIDRELFPADEMVRLFFGTERDAYQPVTLQTGEGVLDERGRLRIPIQTPTDREEGFLTLSVIVAGPDRIRVGGTGRLALSTAPLAVDLRTDRRLYGPEDVALVTVRAQRADGRPAAGRRGVCSLALAPEAAANEAPEETWLQTLPFETDERGEAHLRAPLAGTGRYVLAASLPRTAEEGEGSPIHARIHVWAAGDRATPGPAGVGLRVVADRDSFAVGDEAHLLVLPEGRPRPVLATLEGEGFLDVRVLVPGEVPPLWRIPIEERYAPNVFATFSTVVSGRVLTTTQVLRIPPRTRLLSISVTPDADEIDPGASSGLSLKVLDDDARPVAGAEVAVAVVDEALFALHPDPGAPIEAFFYPPRRNAVQTIPLLDVMSVGWWVPMQVPGRLADGAVTAEAAPPPSAAMPAPTSPAPMRGGAGRAAAPAEAEPSPEPSAVMEEEMDEESAGEDDGNAEGYGVEETLILEKKGEGRAEPAVRVREDFRTAVFWEPALQTDADGLARADVPYADTLTRWRISALGVDAASRVGTGRAHVRTRRSVAAQITLPRFLRVGDEAQAPVVLRNLTDTSLAAEWSLGVSDSEGSGGRRGSTTLDAHGLETLEQVLVASRIGTLEVNTTLRTSAGADAERRTLEVLPRGILKVEGATLFARDGTTTTSLQVPANAEAGSVSLRATIEPAYAQAMLAALPYLLDYPHGCTEQTLHRFLPLLAAVEALNALGRPPEGLATALPEMVDAGLSRLAALQHKGGGFGWWEQDATDLGMTALVLRGLNRLVGARPDDKRAIALRDATAVALRKAVEGAPATLDATTRASATLALVGARALPPGSIPPLSAPAWRTMGPQAQALMLRAAVAVRHGDLVAALKGQLDDVAQRTEDGRLFWSASSQGSDRPERWQDDTIETTASVLRALLEAGVRPEVLDGGARWLLEARLGGDRWRSTRDTGAAVEFLAAHARATGDLGAGRKVTLRLGDTVLWEGALDAERAVGAPLVQQVPAEFCTPGAELAFSLTCAGGSASTSLALAYYETGPAIRATDHGFGVVRRFFQLTPVEQDGTVTFRRTPVTETVPAGTLLEVEIEVTTPRPREYVMVVSRHAGAFEPVREVGMEVPGREAARDARIDRRDDRTLFFVARLPAGTHRFRHSARATHAGTFAALPASAELMYFPEVRGNSDGELWQITPTGPVGTDGR